jgi:type IV secretion system protein VirB9
MKKTILASVIGALFATVALAEDKPGLPPNPNAEPVTLKVEASNAGDKVPAISGPAPATTASGAAPDTKLTAEQQWESLVAAPPQAKMEFRTRKAAEEALTAAFEAGKISNLPPIAGDDGIILYPYGQSWPTVVCSPLHVCVVQLGKGDKPSQVVLGQPGMWQMTQAMAGDTPLLALSPRFKDLHTNLMITATSATGEPRVYYVNLVSDNAKYVPKVGFYFPEAISTAWKQQAQAQQMAQAAAKAQADAAARRVADQTVATLPSLNVANLDFRWKSACASKDSSWFSSAPSCEGIKPTRVFDDGVHTYVQMPASLSDTTGLPTIMASNTAGQPAVLNFRFKGGYYVIDGVPAKILLVAGNGNGSEQKIVELTHETAEATH